LIDYETWQTHWVKKILHMLTIFWVSHILHLGTPLDNTIVLQSRSNEIGPPQNYLGVDLENVFRPRDFTGKAFFIFG
jgi:hypothetical protein